MDPQALRGMPLHRTSLSANGRRRRKRGLPQTLCRCYNECCCVRPLYPTETLSSSSVRHYHSIDQSANLCAKCVNYVATACEKWENRDENSAAKRTRIVQQDRTHTQTRPSQRRVKGTLPPSYQRQAQPIRSRAAVSQHRHL